MEEKPTGWEDLKEMRVQWAMGSPLWVWLSASCASPSEPAPLEVIYTIWQLKLMTALPEFPPDRRIRHCSCSPVGLYQPIPGRPISPKPHLLPRLAQPSSCDRKCEKRGTLNSSIVVDEIVTYLADLLPIFVLLVGHVDQDQTRTTPRQYPKKKPKIKSKL